MILILNIKKNILTYIEIIHNKEIWWGQEDNYLG